MFLVLNLRPLVADIMRRMLGDKWLAKFSCSHYYREANFAADWAVIFGHQRNWSSFLP